MYWLPEHWIQSLVSSSAQQSPNLLLIPNCWDVAHSRSLQSHVLHPCPIPTPLFIIPFLSQVAFLGPPPPSLQAEQSLLASNEHGHAASPLPFDWVHTLQDICFAILGQKAPSEVILVRLILFLFKSLTHALTHSLTHSHSFTHTLTHTQFSRR